MKELTEYLRSIPAGSVSNTYELERHLAVCWDELFGNDAEGMTAYKLHGRMEKVRWQDPLLTFEIERHGGTALGSTRADRQEWTIDLGKRSASCRFVGYRQVKPRQPGLDVRPMAQHVAQLILTHADDECLKWNADGSVRVLIGEILPLGSAVTQTLEGRRKRFRNTVEALLRQAGWERTRGNVYKPVQSLSARAA